MNEIKVKIKTNSGRHVGLISGLKMHQPISRRTVLQGVGVALAVPWLEAMARGASKAKQGKPPLDLEKLEQNGDGIISLVVD